MLEALMQAQDEMRSLLSFWLSGENGGKEFFVRSSLKWVKFYETNARFSPLLFCGTLEITDSQLKNWKSISHGREQKALAAYLQTSLNLTDPSTRSVVIRTSAGLLFCCFLQLFTSFKGPWWLSPNISLCQACWWLAAGPVLVPLELCHGVGDRAKWGHPLLRDWKAQLC